MKKIISCALSMSFLSGCVPFSVGKDFTKFVNGEKELPDVMLKKHLSGLITTDEEAPDDYPRPIRGGLYLHGVVEGKPEYLHRVGRVALAWNEGFMWISPGDKNYITFGYIPDHLPRLKKGDLVEVRHTRTWDGLNGLLSGGDFNMIVRVLCYRQDPLYELCLKQAPKTGSNIGKGETGTPYPAMPKDYGFTFSEWYDLAAKPVKAFPPRPF